MARDFAGSTNVDRITTTCSTSVGARTYFIWAYREGTGGGNLGRYFDKNTAGGVQEVLFFDNQGSNTMFAANWNGAEGQWYWNGFPTNNEWHNHLITYDSSSTANDPSMYLDGVVKSLIEQQGPVGTFQTSADPFIIGNRGNGGVNVSSNRCWNGGLAEFAVWDRILSANEITALGKGYSPLFFLTGLVCYVPLVRSLVDNKNAVAVAVNTTIIPHPRIIYPSFAQIRRFGAAAAPSTAIKDLIGPGILAFPR